MSGRTTFFELAEHWAIYTRHVIMADPLSRAIGHDEFDWCSFDIRSGVLNASAAGEIFCPAGVLFG